MYIELKEATHIAEYLMKGAFQKNYPDISISIGKDIFIGINKVGSRNMVFILILKVVRLMLLRYICSKTIFH